MQKLFIAPAIAGLAVSLAGTTHARVSGAFDLGRRLSPAEMRETQGAQGANYLCNFFVCQASGLECTYHTPTQNQSKKWTYYGGKVCSHTGVSSDFCNNDFLNKPCTLWQVFNNPTGCSGDIDSDGSTSRSKCAT